MRKKLEKFIKVYSLERTRLTMYELLEINWLIKIKSWNWRNRYGNYVLRNKDKKSWKKLAKQHKKCLKGVSKQAI